MKSVIIIIALLGLALPALGERTCVSKAMLKKCPHETKAAFAAIKKNDTHVQADLSKTNMGRVGWCIKNVSGCKELLCEITMLTPIHEPAFKEIYSCLYRECGCGDWSQKGLLQTLIDEAESELFAEKVKGTQEIAS